MFTPHATECTEFGEVGSSSQFLFDEFEFFFCKPKLLSGFCCYFHFAFGSWIMAYGSWLAYGSWNVPAMTYDLFAMSIKNAKVRNVLE